MTVQPATVETIIVRDDRWQSAILRFAERSPLADCATITRLEHGNVAVISVRPVSMLSTGERQAWALLEDLVDGDLADFLAHAAPQTLASVGDMFAHLTFAAVHP